VISVSECSCVSVLFAKFQEGNVIYQMIQTLGRIHFETLACKRRVLKGQSFLLKWVGGTSFNLVYIKCHMSILHMRSTCFLNSKDKVEIFLIKKACVSSNFVCYLKCMCFSHAKNRHMTFL
jgi:hypothetical protein